tara:strand:+ start:828 stop:1466 length:639 start_codon:yes stop_codon:yes gene_type:complete
MNNKNSPITIIDYGVGNIFSIYNSVKKISNNVIITNKYSEIEKSQCIILPGVGSFLSAIKNLKKNNLYNMIKQKGNKGTKIIGVCLGMQILMKYGNENGYTEGLGFFEGECVKIKNKNNYKIPNVGLRGFKINNKIKNNLFKKFKHKEFYHLHSYKVKIKQDLILAWSHIGDFNYNIPALIKKKNIIGFQFHPEKSSEDGNLFLKEILNKVS